MFLPYHEGLNNNSKKFLAVSLMIILLKELTTLLSISHG